MVWKTCRWLFSWNLFLPHSIPTCGRYVLAQWRRPCRYHRCGTIGHICLTFNLVGGPVVQVRILAVPESHSPFPSNRTLHVVPQALAQSRIGCSSRRRSPREWSFSQVQTESGGARVEHLTLSSRPISSSSSGFPSSVMSAQCCSLPRRTSSECSCILFLTISNPSASSLVAGVTCVRHVWRQFLPCTQIVSLARSLQAHTSLGPTPGTCSPHRVSDGFTLVFLQVCRAGGGAALHLHTCPPWQGAISSVGPYALLPLSAVALSSKTPVRLKFQSHRRRQDSLSPCRASSPIRHHNQKNGGPCQNTKMGCRAPLPISPRDHLVTCTTHGRWCFSLVGQENL